MLSSGKEKHLMGSGSIGLGSPWRKEWSVTSLKSPRSVLCFPSTRWQQLWVPVHQLLLLIRAKLEIQHLTDSFTHFSLFRVSSGKIRGNLGPYLRSQLPSGAWIKPPVQMGLLLKFGCLDLYFRILRLLHDRITAMSEPFTVETAAILYLIGKDLPQGFPKWCRTDDRLFNLTRLKVKSKVWNTTIMELHVAVDIAIADHFAEDL